MTRTLSFVLLLATLAFAAADKPVEQALDRKYQPGATLKYLMKGKNHGWEYQIEATIITKKDDSGAFYDEIAWSNLQSNAPMTLSDTSLAFRETLSLDRPEKYMKIPDLSRVQPFLIGPITDLMAFYSDLVLAKSSHLTQVGQHAYVEHGIPNSWADGQRVTLGQDAIDFDITALAANELQHTVTLLIKHVPPKTAKLHLPAQWMLAPVADTPNNWVDVEKDSGKYTAQVGKETFEVHLVLDAQDGKILSADLHNPVVALSRDCTDAELLHCGDSQPQTITREVTVTLQP